MLAMRHWKELRDLPTERLDEWYPEFQRRLLEGI